MQSKIQRCSSCTPQHKPNLTTELTQVAQSEHSFGGQQERSVAGQPDYYLPTTSHLRGPATHHHETDVNVVVEAYNQLDDVALKKYVLMQLEDALSNSI